jgi:hypothetical protein
MPVPTLAVGAAQIIAPLSTMLFSTVYESEKASCGTRWSILGTTMSKSRQHNTYETKLLILKAPPNATKTLRRALWVMMKSGGRRPGRSKTGLLLRANNLL